MRPRTVLLTALVLAGCVSLKGEPCTGDDCAAGLDCVIRNRERVCLDDGEPYCRDTTDCPDLQRCSADKACGTPCVTASDCPDHDGTLKSCGADSAGTLFCFYLGLEG